MRPTHTSFHSLPLRLAGSRGETGTQNRPFMVFPWTTKELGRTRPAMQTFRPAAPTQDTRRSAVQVLPAIQRRSERACRDPPNESYCITHDSKYDLGSLGLPCEKHAPHASLTLSNPCHRECPHRGTLDGYVRAKSNVVLFFCRAPGPTSPRRP